MSDDLKHRMAPMHDPNELREGMPEPDYQGAHGRAWKVDNAVGIATLGIKPGDEGTCAMWLIEAPYAHPVWHSYVLILIHLRPTKFLPEPRIYRLGATHEFWIDALTPDSNRAAYLKSGGIFGESTANTLSPSNFAAQLVEETDTEAVQKIDDVVRDICEARLNPDTDFRRNWIARFGDAMIRLEYQEPPTRTLQ